MSNRKRTSRGGDAVEVEWMLLASLARIIQVHPASGAVTIVNGRSRITLATDGTIRLDGARIIASAGEHAMVSAPRIDLN